MCELFINTTILEVFGFCTNSRLYCWKMKIMLIENCHDLGFDWRRGSKVWKGA